MLMTNRRLYAQLSAAFVWLWCGQSVVAQPRPLDPPCGACINITIAAGQLLLLPETLSGLTVLVRITAPSDPGLPTVFDEIRRRGGRPGLAVVVSEQAVTTLDRLAFDVKQTLTEYRAAVGSSPVIAVVAPAVVRVALLDRGLAAYADLLPTHDRHPFIAHRPAEIYFDIWGVVTSGAGHQIPHIHPSAWLSGVFWAELPALGPREDPRGWLELGGPDRALPGDVAFPVRAIEPRLGWVALFPSYLYHHTLPTGVDEARVSVAFDVLPFPARA